MSWGQMVLPIRGSVRAIWWGFHARFADARLRGCSLEEVVVPPVPFLRSWGPLATVWGLQG